MIAGILAALIGIPAFTPTEPVTVTAATSAWYDMRLGCSTSLGCLAVPVSIPHGAFPAGTLHVGQTLGQETQRTYVHFDTASIGRAKVRSGSIQIPIALSLGTTGLDKAHVVACYTSGPVVQHDGGSDVAPDADCTVVRIPLAIQGPAQAPVLVGDLAPYLAFKDFDASDLNLAIVADTKAGAATDSWQVVFDQRQRMTATLDAPSRTPKPPVSPASSAQPPQAGAQQPSPESAAPLETPPSAQPTQAPAAAVVEPKSAHSGRADRFGIAWALPLGLAGLLWLMWQTAGADIRSLRVRRPS